VPKVAPRVSAGTKREERPIRPLARGKNQTKGPATEGEKKKLEKISDRSNFSRLGGRARSIHLYARCYRGLGVKD